MTGLHVTGLDPVDGQVRLRVLWEHGRQLDDLLAEHGWRSTGDVDVTGRRDPHEVELRIVLAPADPGSPSEVGLRPTAVPRDADLVAEPGEVAHQVQRISVYAVVTSARGLLLTAYSDLTNAPGWIGLPGGGLDPGELPEEGLHREVAEETGQQVVVTGLLGVRTSRWIGRAPSGRLEDFQTVRIIYLAQCPAPTDPVVHDIGGTTAYAVWSPLSQVAALPLTTTCRAVWEDYLALA